MDKTNIFMYFIIYSFIGWVLETIYCSTLEKKFVYRGFLNGPICPIYGFGALIVLGALEGFYPYPALVYILGLVLTSGLEYITSFLLETFFNMKWWDYSKKKFNINGRVCLLNSTLFGLLSLVLIYLVHPRIYGLVRKIPARLVNPISNLIFSILVLDTIVTIAELLNLTPNLDQLESKLKDFELEFEARYGEVIERANIKTMERELRLNYLKEQRKKLKENFENKIEEKTRELKLGFSTRRILKSYPSLRSSRNPKSIIRIKKILNERKK